MIIPIPTTQRKFFRQVLEILKPIPPLNLLRNKELDVLAEFLYYNDKYSHLEKDIRSKIVFDYDTKLDMREYLNMDEQSFNNHMTSLRKKGILTKRSVENTFGIDIKSPIITFQFLWEKKE